MLKETQTHTHTDTKKKTVMSIKRVTYQAKLALYYTSSLVVKHNINLSSNPGHLNPWIDSNIGPDKWQNYKNNFEEFIIKAALKKTLRH